MGGQRRTQNGVKNNKGLREIRKRAIWIVVVEFSRQKGNISAKFLLRE